MKRVIQIIVLALTVALGFWVCRILFPDDTAVIQKLLVEMAEDASFDSNEGQLTKISKAGKLANYFTVDAKIDVKPWSYHQVSVSGRTEIRQAAVGARSTIASLVINVDRIKVVVATDRESAQANLSLTARSGAREEPWIEGMEIQLSRINGAWLISRVINRQFIKQ